jgi:hypothetical protein
MFRKLRFQMNNHGDPAGSPSRGMKRRPRRATL